MDAWMDGGPNFDGAEALGLPWGAQVAMGNYSYPNATGRIFTMGGCIAVRVFFHILCGEIFYKELSA